MIAWRVISSGSASGGRNMAIDEALLNSFVSNRSLPTLRFYRWEKPTLSIGRFQKPAEILDLESCILAGTSVVRRITGGGVLYHADELTYSIVCSPSHIPEATSIKDAYRILTSFLIIFYRTLGLNAQFAANMPEKPDKMGVHTDYCFAGVESYDIILDRKKMGGNAQRRLKNAIFQHGSIPLKNCSAIGNSYMRKPSIDIETKTTALYEHQTVLSDIESRLMEAFCQNIDCEAYPDLLTKEEELMSEILEKEKYSSDLWNLCGVSKV